MEPMVFESLEKIEVPVKIAGKDYMLTEVSESGAAKYKNAQMSSTRVVEGADGNKHATVSGLSDTEGLLVSQCLFEVTANNGRKSVELNIIKTWPHRITKQLFDKAEEISGLGVKETEETLKKRLKDTQEKLKKLYPTSPSPNGDVAEVIEEDTVKNS